MKNLSLLSLLLILFIENSTAQPTNSDPFELYLDCTLQFFENGTDTGMWTDGVLVSVKNGAVEFDGFIEKYGLGEITAQRINFSSLESYGSFNRLTGKLMIINAANNTVSRTGDCKSAMPKF